MRGQASFFAPRQRLELEDGRSLRLLSAKEVLEARREGQELAVDQREKALCANACLLARALEKRGRPVFADGSQVLGAMRVEEIGRLARIWSEFNRRENPSAQMGEQGVEELKKAWSTRLMSVFSGVCFGSLGLFLPKNGRGT